MGFGRTDFGGGLPKSEQLLAFFMWMKSMNAKKSNE